MRYVKVDLHTSWVAIITVIPLSPFQGGLIMLLSMKLSPINHELTWNPQEIQVSYSFFCTLTSGLLVHQTNSTPLCAGPSLSPLVLST